MLDEAFGDAKADAAVAAGYEGDFVVERLKGEVCWWWDMGDLGLVSWIVWVVKDICRDSVHKSVCDLEGRGLCDREAT